MNKCKNCKYFKRNDGKNYSSNKYGKCECSKFIYGDGFDGERNNESKSDELFYMDYEWFKAFVEVGENFGCIHFKQREGDK